ncbi:hypothetical protein GHK69_10165 [Sinorhizobium meliloti]|nr:hypothetical protein [Sinorhizobium meliloti]
MGLDGHTRMLHQVMTEERFPAPWGPVDRGRDRHLHHDRAEGESPRPALSGAHKGKQSSAIGR